MHTKIKNFIIDPNNEMVCEEANKKSKEEIIKEELQKKKEILLKNISEELINKLKTTANVGQAYNDIVTAFKYYEGIFII